MTDAAPPNPFHAGELEAHRRAGVGDVAQWAGGFIRNHLPEQHRDFHTSLPFLVVSGADADGLTWVTLIEGEDGFIRSPDPQSVTLNARIDDQDPLSAAFNAGTEVGVVGIDLATRRRNRFNGHFHKMADGYAIAIRQTFGNCPQYIHERAWTRAAKTARPQAVVGTHLSPSQTALIRRSDTMFIGTGHAQGGDVPSRGYDASHRGGAAGFVHVSDGTHLHIPDYAGNQFFNTIGNLITDPRIGVVFVDFATGGVLHVSGRATVDWAPVNAHDRGALRMINIEIDAVIERPGAMSLRWTRQDHALKRLKVVRRVVQADDVISLHLRPLDGTPLPPFVAGQHLPVQVQIPGQTGTSKRNYSLSGAPDAMDEYRLTIKRQANGLVSRFLHDDLREGGTIEASKPAGDFTIPCDKCPLVLVSAGVGITPMTSMLHAAAADTHARPIYFVHGARSGKEHALREEIDTLVAQHSAVQHLIFYSKPDVGDTFDVAGRITVGALLDLNAGADAHYMLCGPVQFMSQIKTDLETSGVPIENIHFETFGPPP